MSVVRDEIWAGKLLDERRPTGQYISRLPKKPERPRDASLRYEAQGLTMRAEHVSRLLDEDNLYKDAGTLVQVCTAIAQGRTTTGFVWTNLKPYHMQRLAYQLAAAVKEGTITRSNADLRQMSVACYKMMITAFERRAQAAPELREAKRVPMYTQWMAQAGEATVNNLTILYYFLKNECHVPGLPGFGKLQ